MNLLRLHATLALGVFATALFLGCGSNETHATSTSGSGGNGGSGGGGVCVVAPRPEATLPHVSLAGDQARAVAHAIDAILAVQTPPVGPGAHTYASSTLTCANIWAPDAPNGFGCSFDLRIDGGEAIDVVVDRPSPLANDLYDALAVGEKHCNDQAHGDFIRASSLSLDLEQSRLELDDDSSFDLPPEPNVVVDESAGAAVLDAFTRTSTSDCDASARLFLVCTALGTAPTCSASKTLLRKVGGSELVYTCTPTEQPAPVELDATASAAIWKAIIGAADAAGYQPLHGKPSEATVINASYFQYDGAKLGFVLVADDVSPPPPPMSP